MLAYITKNWFNASAFGVLFLTIVLFAYTGNLFILLTPLVYLYLVLVGLNWRAAYWLFLFTIPASIQINFAADTMAITLPDEPIMWIFLLLFALVYASGGGATKSCLSSSSSFFGCWLRLDFPKYCFFPSSFCSPSAGLWSATSYFHYGYLGRRKTSSGAFS
jgi:hypothetical protein